MDALGDTPAWKYAHDVMPHLQTGVRDWLADNTNLVFCSPLQREYMGLEGECIPPAMDLTRYRCPRPSEKRRDGTVSIAQWRNPGKGAGYVEDYALEEPVDVYGPGPFLPRGKGIAYCGEVAPELMPQTLWHYRNFVFLPFSLEPFCRTVVEAHAAGCDLVINGLIGARHYLEEAPEKLESAGTDFWNLVTAQVAA
jgi:hypothetical protein